MAGIATAGLWLEEAEAAVRAGSVVALPFERLFGLAALALEPAAVGRAAAIKGRAGGHPIPVIVPDPGAVGLVAASFPPLAAALAARHWPGPLTLLVPARPGLPAELTGPGGLVGVRVPGPSPALDLARRVGAPLTATSANPTGAPDALSHLDLLALGGLALIVPGGVPGPPGSTVVDASGTTPIVVRRGALELP